MVIGEADVLEDVWCFRWKTRVVDGIEGDGEDILQHFCLGHLAIADHRVALESGVEPHSHLPHLIDADHLLVDWEVAHYFAQLPESIDADIQEVDHIRERHVFDVGQPQRHGLDDHLLCISRELLD